MIKPGQVWECDHMRFTVDRKVEDGLWSDTDGVIWHSTSDDSDFHDCQLISVVLKPENIGSKLDTVHMASTGEVRVTDPKTGGQKGKKPEAYALIPAAPLAELARVFGYGSDKYEAWNWSRGYAWNLSVSALFRHIERWRAGESIDPESGRHHLAMANFHLMILQEFERLGLGTDDRQPK